MAKAYKFKKSDILAITIEKTFDNIEDMEKNDNVSNGNLVIELDMEGFNDYMKNDEILSEEFDTNDYLEEVEKLMHDYFINNHTLNLNITKEFNGDNVTKKDITEAIDLLNDCLQEEIDSELGSELEIYINKKEEEAHNGLTIDFSNDIRSRVRDRLRSERPKDYFIFTNHSNVLSSFDMKQQNEDYLTTSGDFGLSNFRPNTKKREEVERILSNSDFVIDYKYSGVHNDRLHITVNKQAKDILKQICLEETQKYYSEKSQLDYQTKENEKFIEKSGNHKGGLMDVYYNKSKNKVIIIENSGTKQIDLNEQTEDKSLLSAINIVDDYLKEEAKLEKINKIKTKKRKM